MSLNRERRRLGSIGSSSMKCKKQGRPSSTLLLGSCAAVLFFATSGLSLAAPYKAGTG